MTRRDHAQASAWMNSDQREYAESLARVSPEERCWCGWFLLHSTNAKVPHGDCQLGRTCADKLAERAASRGAR